MSHRVSAIVSSLVLCLLGWLVFPASAQAAPLREGPAPLEVAVGDEADPVHLGLGASVWLRGQVRDESDELSWQVPQRTRVRVEARWRGLRTFLQFQDVRRWGSSADLTTSATTGLHQGYIEISGSRGRSKGFVRVGRQQHHLGYMRVLGLAPWHPNMRSLDAVRVHGEHGPLSLDVTGVLLRRPQTLSFTDDAGQSHQLRHGGEGLLASALRVAPHRAFDLEVYALLRNYAPTVDEPELDRVVFNPGARIVGHPWRGLYYDLDGYVQSGRWDGLPHSAWLVGGKVGYLWEKGSQPQIEAGYTAASGGGCDRVDDEVVCDRGIHRDFDGLLGARHRFFGIADLFSPTNAHDGWLGLRLQPGGWTDLRVELHHFQLHDPTGRWVRTNGAAVGGGPDPFNRERMLGQEIDIRAGLHPWGPLRVQAGYAAFLPNGAGPRFVGPRPIQFAYLMTQLEF